MAGPLTGVRVVELAGIGPGPLCGMMLADLGAEVIAVERSLPDGPAGVIADMGVRRRGRRSIVADLRRPGAAEIVVRLAADAEVLFEGMRPGVAERLGVGPDTCMAANPGLVYARMTGWGQEGPLSAEAGHDINYLALTGALHAIGRDRPTPPLNLVGDFGGGTMLLAVGILAGLVHARATGEGQVVDASMYDGVNLLMTMFWEQFAQGRWRDEREANLLDGGAPFYDVYACADGQWVAVGAIEPRFRRALFDRLGLTWEQADLGLDPSRWPELRRRIAAVFGARPREDWVRLFENTDACVTPVLSLAEAPNHRQATDRKSFLPARHGVQPAPAPRFKRTPATAPTPPPPRGADTDAILAEAGYDADARRQLRADGIVA